MNDRNHKLAGGRGRGRRPDDGSMFKKGNMVEAGQEVRGARRTQLPFKHTTKAELIRIRSVVFQ